MGGSGIGRNKLIAESNPGIKPPDLTITTVVRQDGCGTTYAFTNHLDAIIGMWQAKYGAAITPTIALGQPACAGLKRIPAQNHFRIQPLGDYLPFN